jgi:hypothetical protein
MLLAIPLKENPFIGKLVECPTTGRILWPFLKIAV